MCDVCCGFCTTIQGRIQGPGAPSLKLEKIGFFDVNRDFSHEIPQKFSRLPPQLEKIWFFGVTSWFFTRNTKTNFAPPSARRNFLSAPPPPNLKSWIRPCYLLCLYLSEFFLVNNVLLEDRTTLQIFLIGAKVFTILLNVHVNTLRCHVEKQPLRTLYGIYRITIGGFLSMNEYEARSQMFYDVNVLNGRLGVRLWLLDQDFLLLQISCNNSRCTLCRGQTFLTVPVSCTYIQVSCRDHIVLTSIVQVHLGVMQISNFPYCYNIQYHATTHRCLVEIKFSLLLQIM